MSRRITCPDCGGSGRVEQLIVRLATGDGELVLKLKCKQCEGEGVLKVNGPVKKSTTGNEYYKAFTATMDELEIENDCQ
jgi:DnaJ-class molecular chaperone